MFRFSFNLFISKRYLLFIELLSLIKLEGKPLTVVGDGEQSRDFVYVTDVAKAFYSAAISNIFITA